VQYQTIVGKINEFLLEASTGCAKWLDKNLPPKTDRWERFVLTKLSDHQRQLVEQNGWTNFSELDLSALLRVADRNKYIISQKYFLNHNEIECIRKMFLVRNRWAHCSTEPIQLPQVISDLETLKFFYGQTEIERQTVKELSDFINIVRTEGITGVSQPAEVIITPVKAVSTESEQINVNTIVHLTSNPKMIGMVQSISDIGNTKQYQVFIDGSIKSFFDNQIALHSPTQNNLKSDITDLLRVLTARQISCPSSNSLYSLNSSRIDFVPYQFRPVLKLIKSETPRLLIADSVGVGKTIEAGLILKEMQVRAPLDIVIIICPKPLVAEKKWEREMKEKFGEEFIPADSSLLRLVIQNYARDGVWDDRYKRLIIPYSILKDELLNGVEGRNSHSGLKNMIPTPIFDMVIVDEAHHIRNQNQAHRVVKYLCEHANAALFLTATPIQLGNQDLFTLLNLLFPDVVIDKASFEAMVQPNEYINNAVKLLRGGTGYESEALDSLKKASATEWGHKVIAPNPVFSKVITTLEEGELNREKRVGLINDVESLHSFSHMINRTRRQDIEDFCIRRAKTLESEFTQEQKELHDKLLDFERTVLTLLHGNVSAKFLMSMISRQASSCLFGLAPFIRSLISNRLSDLFDEYDDNDDETEKNELDLGAIGEMAKDVVALSENLPVNDPKFDTLAQILKERQKPQGGKTIVFSTFRNTLSYLYKRIKSEIGLRVEQVNGSVPDEERYNLRERFALPKENENAIDVLLFSEVGAEGLDYQFCNAIVNYDLPWNPMRIEQRIGRIDRRGQKSEVVYIYNCITNGTIDADIYHRCYERINIFEKSLGECSDILGDIENSIKDIVVNQNLTPEERSLKLEKMMDNEVFRINETHRLEEEGKEMFGIDISNFTDDIEKADNPWVSSTNIKCLVEGYLTKRLGSENQHIIDKMLKLSNNEKTLILEDYNTYARKYANEKIWVAYLNSPKQSCSITFTQEEAKEKRKSIFITPSHPLVRQASQYFSDGKNIKMAFAVSVSGKDVPAAVYPFSIFSWEYTGLRPRVEFVPISNESVLDKELLNLLQEAVTIEIDLEQYNAIWKAQEEKHLSLWQNECNRYKAEVRSNCDFKIASLAKSLETRKLVAERQLAGVDDARIELMRYSQIERLEGDFEVKKTRIENSAKEVDIHTTLIANGVLIVRGE
jgi:SNF2 family DNA or RNA helicase